jgi:hypothetical protein
VTCGSEEIVYAPDVNHLRERLLDPSALDSLARPSVLIAGATSALCVGTVHCSASLTHTFS